MRRPTAIILATLALFGTYLTPVAWAADSCRVTLRTTDPVWNRPKDTGSGGGPSECSAVAFDSQNNALPYRAVRFRTSVSEAMSITVTSQEPATSSFDPFIGVYCTAGNAFNAATPLSNLIALDDDSAGWPNASIAASRNIFLRPNTDYVLVISAYASNAGAPTPFGTVRITLGGSARFVQTLPGCCIADINQNGVVSAQDIFDFLSAWFALAPAADVNGIGGVTVQDIFDFLNVWFLGC